MTRITAAERLSRIVAIIPWIAERDGPTVDEICERFTIDRSELLADLDVVFMVGIPPYTPDELIDVFIDDDRVWVRLGDYFRRPLRLTTAEALRVVAAAETFAGVSGADPSGPLARGLAKVAGTLGIGDRGVISVNVGAGRSEVGAAVHRALSDGESLDITYHAASNDEITERRIDPHRIFSTDGHLYLAAWCHRAGGDRVFRMDRIRSASPTGAPRHVDATGHDATHVFFGGQPVRSVRLRLKPSARWVLTAYESSEVTAGDDGRLDAVLPVGGDAWLGQLLVRLGSDAEVVEYLDAEGRDLGVDRALAIRRDLARQMLDRYA